MPGILTTQATSSCGGDEMTAVNPVSPVIAAASALLVVFTLAVALAVPPSACSTAGPSGEPSPVHASQPRPAW